LTNTKIFDNMLLDRLINDLMVNLWN